MAPTSSMQRSQPIVRHDTPDTRQNMLSDVFWTIFSQLLSRKMMSGALERSNDCHQHCNRPSCSDLCFRLHFNARGSSSTVCPRRDYSRQSREHNNSNEISACGHVTIYSSRQERSSFLFSLFTSYCPQFAIVGEKTFAFAAQAFSSSFSLQLYFLTTTTTNPFSLCISIHIFAFARNLTTAGQSLHT